MRMGKENFYNSVCNLCASLWSLQILVLYYQGNVLVLYAVVRSLYQPQPMYIIELIQK